MTTIFIIHGAFGNPEENWFPWIKQKLEEENHEVIMPRFPTPENQNFKEWEKVFEKFKSQINSDSIFIGHSLGPAFILSILEQLDKPIKGAFFVSGFFENIGIETFDSINKSFINKEFNWTKIKNNCNKFFTYFSDNDPYVPIKCAQELANKLNTKLNIIPKAGHFNESSGYSKFDRLLKDIKQFIKENNNQ